MSQDQACLTIMQVWWRTDYTHSSMSIHLGPAVVCQVCILEVPALVGMVVLLARDVVEALAVPDKVQCLHQDIIMWSSRALCETLRDDGVSISDMPGPEVAKNFQRLHTPLRMSLVPC